MSERPITYPKGTVKYLGTNRRAIGVALPDGLPAVYFPDLPKTDKFVKKFNMDDDVQRKQFEALCKCKLYTKGDIFYVKSPEELQAESLKRQKAEKFKTIKQTLEDGFFSMPDLEAMDLIKVREFADSIGVEYTYYDPNSGKEKAHRKDIVLSEVYKAFGLDEDAARVRSRDTNKFVKEKK